MRAVAAVALALALASCEDARTRELKRFREESAMRDFAVALLYAETLAAQGRTVPSAARRESDARAALVAACAARRSADECERLARDVQRSPEAALKWKTLP